MTKLHEVVENIKFGTIKQDIPEIKIGDLVRVGVAIQEGNKERVQPF
jgi:large subunit ribosomal protein L19